MAAPRTQTHLTGLRASPGFAIGPALVIRATAAERKAGSIEDEKCALNAALDQAKRNLDQLRQSQDELAADILEFQITLIEDDELTAPAFQKIADGKPADTAWAEVLDDEIKGYIAAEDDYMAARAHDLLDLRDRVIRVLGGTGDQIIEPAEGAIIHGDDLTPSAFLELDWKKLGGAALKGGSPTSHVAILARARGVPMIVGLTGDGDIAGGDSLILDADNGTLTVHPDGEALAEAKKRLAGAREQALKAAALLHQKAVTRDGEAVTMLINVDDPAMLDDIDPESCDGIGLARTEFLFHHGHLPSEDEQFGIYEKMLRFANGRPVTIRTVDAGGDKPVPGLTIDHEKNPFLGLRGLRLSLLKPEIFKTQLYALARAAAAGPLKVMLPMVTTPAEFLEARAHLDAVMADLETRSMAASRPLLGIMVETPAAALTAERFEADFYSIGSNDLIQYVTASARDEPALAPLADPRSPAVLELIERTIKAARQRGVEVSLCGDMASDPDLVPILLGLGLRTLSVAPAQLGSIKLAVAASSTSGGASDQAR